MSFIGAVSNAVKTVVQKAEQKAEQTTAQVRAQTPQVPTTPAAVRDCFQSVPRPRVDLGLINPTASANANGVHAALTVDGHRLAAFGVSPAGVSVNALGNTDGATWKGGVGHSTAVAGKTYGVHFKAQESEGTLGAVTEKLGDQEVTVGAVPSAPAPLPIPVYVGPVRDDDQA